jgi:hypothetical protein
MTLTVGLGIVAISIKVQIAIAEWKCGIIRVRKIAVHLIY